VGGAQLRTVSDAGLAALLEEPRLQVGGWGFISCQRLQECSRGVYLSGLAVLTSTFGFSSRNNHGRFTASPPAAILHSMQQAQASLSSIALHCRLHWHVPSSCRGCALCTGVWPPCMHTTMMLSS
jgi:hypothetical protein